MVSFAIIEVDDGFMIVQVASGQSPEDAALSEGGTLVDPGPFDSFEDANDELDRLEELDDQESYY